MHMRINFSEPVNNVWIHGVFYYRYNVNSYQKFPIDLWEDVCAWLGGDTHNYFLKWTGKNAQKFSNLNHTCPYDGSVWIKIDKIPVNRLFVLEPFLPSGRYRIDLNITRGFKKRPFMITRFFFAISDNRIEQF